ncbi:TonB-dependent receptor [Pseudoflavitalea sp. G-6-1-2]|uniref:outer membrane beta-barrel family protein n=1 Tax=Pseudoflavitalea sp. G-6-1-2 TaxID=2728841 RepID=UPI00146D9E48|nr:outer membrane beta-barrel family protein [Pseudoflavitalea sp. G-6-1-2]NML23736.1 TonB-dependent receptor [Pseudoflavitalea sp. G-6-1-2]
MKKILFLLLSLFFAWQSFSQAITHNEKPKGRLYGKVVDGKTGKGIDAASIRLYLLSGAGDSLAGGMLTRQNGDFSIDQLNAADSFRLQITAIGYKEISQTVAFSRKGKGEGPVETDLGNIRAEAEAQYLNTVTVVGSKPALQMGIDRKVFDVERNITSSGGTAIDVMKNIPSVNVDVDGNVNLRNRAPQIFVDGRPTILSLDQIPADNIERVELITNPSAQFDAASTGGVINIILKKNRKLGLNGLATAGIGTPGILTGGLSLNLRQNKFNFFVSGNYNKSGGTARGETYRTNFAKGEVSNYFNQFSRGDRSRSFTSLRFGVDYFLDNRNTITLSHNFTDGRFTTGERQEQQYFTAAKLADHFGYRTSDNEAKFLRNNSQLLYKHKFASPGRELSADVNYSWSDSRDFTRILNTYQKPDGSAFAADNLVHNDGTSNGDQLTVQVDFVNPKGEHAKLETGVRSFINNYTTRFDALSLNTGTPVKLPLSNHYKYREMINAAYITYTDKIGSIGYQVGLRAEYSRFDGDLIDSAKKFGYEYPKEIGNLFKSLFPSVFLTKKLTDNDELQLNYTRRIRRPNFWNMNPFVDINDPLNLRMGNPNLTPEFTNSFEFNYNKTYTGGSFLGVIYFRHSTDEITQFSDTLTAEQYKQLNNAAVDPNAILSTFINANSEQNYGLELTLQQKIGSSFDFTPTVNLQYTKVNAKLAHTDLSNEGFNWEGKITANYKISSRSPIWNKLSFQAIGEYESAEVIPQGKRKARYGVDLALRKDFLKDKASVTVAVNDVLNSSRFGAIYDTENFYQDFYRRRNIRSARITFTWKFGKNDFSLFKKERGGGDEMFKD